MVFLWHQSIASISPQPGDSGAPIIAFSQWPEVKVYGLVWGYDNEGHVIFSVWNYILSDLSLDHILTG